MCSFQLEDDKAHRVNNFEQQLCVAEAFWSFLKLRFFKQKLLLVSTQLLARQSGYGLSEINELPFWKSNFELNYKF